MAIPRPACALSCLRSHPPLCRGALPGARAAGTWWTLALIAASIWLGAAPAAWGATEPAHARATTFVRTSSGSWLALGYSALGVWVWQAPAQSDRLSRCTPLVQAAPSAGLAPSGPSPAEEKLPLLTCRTAADERAPFMAQGPIQAAAAYLDGSDRLHLAWQAGGALFYARCAVGRLSDRTAWQGPMGDAAPSAIAASVAPTAAIAAAGARPVIAGDQAGGIAVLRFNGRWEETLTTFAGQRPALDRDAARGLHLAFVAADGVHYHPSRDGASWDAGEVPLPGRVQGRATLAVRDVTPLVAAVVDGRLTIVARRESGWARVPLLPAMSHGSDPALTPDRHGTIWCVWRSEGWLYAARWLGDQFTPAFPLGAADGPFVTEGPPPPGARDLGVLAAVGGEPRIYRLPVPGVAAADDRTVRFLDLLDVSRLEGAASEAIAPVAVGSLPSPANGECLPGSLQSIGRGGQALRAWFSVRDQDRWVGCTAEWQRGRWRGLEPLRLSAPRPWIQPPSGAVVVVDDPDEPAPGRRLKMLAERAGTGSALLTSGDGRTWAYYAEVPPVHPLGLLSDPFDSVEQRWKVYATTGDDPRVLLLTSPDREHWYPATSLGSGLAAADATFWVEDGMVLGLLDGGRRLAAGRDGSRLVPVGELPALAEAGQGRVFAPPVTWQGRRRLFLARPDAWRWLELPATGRWIGLRASLDSRPAICETIPIASGGRLSRRLWVDLRASGTAGVLVEVLDASERTAFSARLRKADGWRAVEWERALSRLNSPAIRLRFTIEPGAVLYGFRFAS